MGIQAVIPSGSTDGAPVKVVATATAGTTFHTASATSGVIDEITMYATNTSAVDVLLTTELGTATAPDNNVLMKIPAQDTVLVLAGVRLQNSKTVKCFAAAANVINVFGNVNRIS